MEEARAEELPGLEHGLDAVALHVEQQLLQDLVHVEAPRAVAPALGRERLEALGEPAEEQVLHHQLVHVRQQPARARGVRHHDSPPPALHPASWKVRLRPFSPELYRGSYPSQMIYENDESFLYI